MIKQKTITVDDWDKKYQPIQNYISKDSSWNGTMFETYAPDIDYVVQVANSNPDTVWTWVDGDAGTYLVNGYHFVNRIGYFVTKIPCDSNTFVEVKVS